MKIILDLALFAILSWAIVEDIRKSQIPRWAYPSLLLLGVIQILISKERISVLESSVLGLVIALLPMLLVAVATKKIGGGDVKLAASAGFALGYDRSCETLFLSLIAMLCFTLIWTKVKHIKVKALPYAPFYAASALLFCLIRI